MGPAGCYLRKKEKKPTPPCGWKPPCFVADLISLSIKKQQPPLSRSQEKDNQHAAKPGVAFPRRGFSFFAQRRILRAIRAVTTEVKAIRRENPGGTIVVDRWVCWGESPCEYRTATGQVVVDISAVFRRTRQRENKYITEYSSRNHAGDGDKVTEYACQKQKTHGKPSPAKQKTHSPTVTRLIPAPSQMPKLMTAGWALSQSNELTGEGKAEFQRWADSIFARLHRTATQGRNSQGGPPFTSADCEGYLKAPATVGRHRCGRGPVGSLSVRLS